MLTVDVVVVPNPGAATASKAAGSQLDGSAGDGACSKGSEHFVYVKQ